MKVSQTVLRSVKFDSQSVGYVNRVVLLSLRAVRGTEYGVLIQTGRDRYCRPTVVTSQ